MKRFKSIFALCGVLCLTPTSDVDAAKKKINADEVITYKTVAHKGNENTLELHIFKPQGHKAGDNRPCMVLFHSGGWSKNDPSKFFSECKKWAKRGIVSISVEYSLRVAHGGTPFDSVTDGKSAIRWIRKNAQQLGVNPNKIVCGGSSAGAQVAAAAALQNSFEEKDEDQSISSKPNALMLWSPVFDNSPEGYGYNKVKKHWKEFSVLHNVNVGFPPTLLFMGDSEPKYLRVEAGEEFQTKMDEVGSSCTLFILKDQKHGGALPQHRDMVWKEKEKFLAALGYLK